MVCSRDPEAGLLLPDISCALPVDRGMFSEEFQQVTEEVPDSIVLYLVMRKNAGGFVEVSITEAFRAQVLDQNCYGRINADESTPVAPVDWVKMRVYLEQTRSRVGGSPNLHGGNSDKPLCRQTSE